MSRMRLKATIAGFVMSLVFLIALLSERVDRRAAAARKPNESKPNERDRGDARPAVRTQETQPADDAHGDAKDPKQERERTLQVETLDLRTRLPIRPHDVSVWPLDDGSSTARDTSAASTGSNPSPTIVIREGGAEIRNLPPTRHVLLIRSVGGGYSATIVDGNAIPDRPLLVFVAPSGAIHARVRFAAHAPMNRPGTLLLRLPNSVRGSFQSGGKRAFVGSSHELRRADSYEFTIHDVAAGLTIPMTVSRPGWYGEQTVVVASGATTDVVIEMEPAGELLFRFPKKKTEVNIRLFRLEVQLRDGTWRAIRRAPPAANTTVQTTLPPGVAVWRMRCHYTGERAPREWGQSSLIVVGQTREVSVEMPTPGPR